MEADDVREELLEDIKQNVALYIEPIQLINGIELVQSLFLQLGQYERPDLVDEAFALLPESAHSDLRRIVDDITNKNGTWLPMVIGRTDEPWRARMRPACLHLAMGFQAALDRVQDHAG